MTLFVYLQAWVTRRRAVLVRLGIEDGTEGWGELLCQMPPATYVYRILLKGRISRRGAMRPFNRIRYESLLWRAMHFQIA